jgi:hypothetical protein
MGASTVVAASAAIARDALSWLNESTRMISGFAGKVAERV